MSAPELHVHVVIERANGSRVEVDAADDGTPTGPIRITYTGKSVGSVYALVENALDAVRRVNRRSAEQTGQPLPDVEQRRPIRTSARIPRVRR